MNSFNALKDPMELALLLSPLADEETEAPRLHIITGVTQVLVVELGFRALVHQPPHLPTLLP